MKLMDLNYAPFEECNDCISRQAAIDIVVCDILSSAIVYGRTEEGMSARKAIVDGLKRLPPVEQKQGWVPVSERLPEKDGEYLVTVKSTFKNTRNYIKHCDFTRNLYLVDEYDFVDKKGVAGFYKYDSEYGYYEMTEVIAWCELPEPYKMCGGDNNDK